VAATDVGVCAVTLGDDPAELERSLREWWFPQATLVKDDPALTGARGAGRGGSSRSRR
jgi:hypothetical protein